MYIVAVCGRWQQERFIWKRITNSFMLTVHLICSCNISILTLKMYTDMCNKDDHSNLSTFHTILITFHHSNKDYIIRFHCCCYMDE